MERNGTVGIQLTIASKLNLSASAFRVDPDGVSTFEQPFQGTTHPCLVSFRFMIAGRSPGATAPVGGLLACMSTYTPPPEGHWSINCVGDTAAVSPRTRKACGPQARSRLNELYMPD
jgi:hypothetical protein